MMLKEALSFDHLSILITRFRMIGGASKKESKNIVEILVHDIWTTRSNGMKSLSPMVQKKSKEGYLDQADSQRPEYGPRSSYQHKLEHDVAKTN